MFLLKPTLLLSVLLAVAAPSEASVSVVDITPAPAGEDRTDIEKATHSLATRNNDIPSLERLIAWFPPEMVDGIDGGISYRFYDEVRNDAWQVLMEWYSIDFLEKTLKEGSDDAAYWALNKLFHQSINSPRKGVRGPSVEGNPRLVALGGAVTNEVLTRLIPALEKVRMVKSERTNMKARWFIKRYGLLTDRADFLVSLQEKDEFLLNASLMQMMDTVRVNPNLTKEIWEILAHAKTDNLQLICLRYDWLFDLPAWDDEKTRLIAGFLELPGDGAATNVDSALSLLAMSNNPLAGRIFAALAAVDSKKVRNRIPEYQQLRRQTKQAKLR